MEALTVPIPRTSTHAYMHHRSDHARSRMDDLGMGIVVAREGGGIPQQRLIADRESVLNWYDRNRTTALAAKSAASFSRHSSRPDRESSAASAVAYPLSVTLRRVRPPGSASSSTTCGTSGGTPRGDAGFGGDQDSRRRRR